MVTISFFSRTFMRWKGMSSAMELLAVEIRELRHGADEAHHGGERIRLAGDGAVDPFGGQQDGAPDAVLTCRLQAAVREAP